MCNSGNMPAHMTAKMVMASEKRLIAGPPLLVQQQEDRRDQRAGVADADPPDEVDDREAPGHRDVDAPDADADVKEPGDGDGQDLEHGEAGQEADPPPSGVRLGQHHLAERIADGFERVLVLHQGVHFRFERQPGRRTRSGKDFSRRHFKLPSAWSGRVRVADGGQVRQPRAWCSAPPAGHSWSARSSSGSRRSSGIVEVAEHDRRRWGRPPGRRS